MNRPDESLKNSIIIYTTEDGLTKIDATFDGDTIWLSIDQMAELFQRDRSVIGKHVRNIFKEGELQKESVWAKFAYTAADGKVYDVDYYNLDVIISVGYRVKSKRGTQFRIWATGILKEYMRKGFALDDERLKIWAAVDISKNCWSASGTSALPKRCFTVRFWKSTLPAPSVHPDTDASSCQCHESGCLIVRLHKKFAVPLVKRRMKSYIFFCLLDGVHLSLRRDRSGLFFYAQ